MPGRPQPRGIVERSSPSPDHAIPRGAANPGAAFRAHQASADPPAIGRSLDRSRLDTAEAKGALGYDNPDREGAAGYPLTVGAVAGVNHLRRFGNLVAKLAAMAAASLRELHRSISPR